MNRIRFYYDVVCPYSYMESHVVEAAEDEGRLEVEWLPFELRPAPKPLLEVRGDHLRTDWTSNVYRRALAAGIEIHLPRYQPRSTLTLGACLWAGDEGRLRAFKHALYEAFFCEGLDIATDAEIGRAAERAGLDPVAPWRRPTTTPASSASPRDPRARPRRRRRRRADAPHRGRTHPLGHGRRRAAARGRAARASRR